MDKILQYAISKYISSPEGKKMTELFTYSEDIAIQQEREIEINDLYGVDFFHYEDQSDSNIRVLYDRLQNDCHFSLEKTIEELKLDIDNITYDEFYNTIIEHIVIYVSDTTYISEDEVRLYIECQKDDYRRKASWIPTLSVELFYSYPDFPFIPLLFWNNFQEFVDRCNLLGITIPPIPLQSESRERCAYYGELSTAIKQFMDEYSLTKEQMCAILYDFAPSRLEKDSPTDTPLPAPTRIWLTGADKSDYELTLTKSNDDTVTEWACNEDTKRGDIVIVYARTPYSIIHSIWRAANDGSTNPFTYYCNRINVTKPIVIPPITIKELKSDPYFSLLPIVRKNLQGINGIELSTTDYAELLKRIKDKNFDISILPQIESPELDLNLKIKNEKDVEEKLLIPLLEKLGYQCHDNKDWQRQLVIKLGLREKYIPDFVFFPHFENNYQVTSPFLIEAKYYMKNNNERIAAFSQACSYARPLTATLFAICDKTIFRVYKNSNQYFTEDDIIFDDTWKNIQKPEVFNSLRKIIGRDIISPK